MYEVEIIHKKTFKSTTVETDTFKREYSTGRLGHKTEKTLLAIGIPNGKRYIKWFNKIEYSVIVRELQTGRIIETLQKRCDNMWILETIDGDRWTYDENELENARRDKYIFGGEITHIEEE